MSENNKERSGSLLSIPYPDVDEWKAILATFSAQAVAHKMLLSTVPFVFRNEPLKFALFRRTIADEFGVNPTDVFIVGSGLAGRSLKPTEIHQLYSSESDIDTLIISEHLYTSYVMRSLEWVADITESEYKNGKWIRRELEPKQIEHIGFFSSNAANGIWRPDSFPKDTPIRVEFFKRFAAVSIKVL